MNKYQIITQVYFKDPSGNPFQLTKGQSDIFRIVYEPEITRGVIRAVTQYGKSDTTSMAILTMAVRRKEKILIVSPSEKQSRIIMSFLIGHVFDDPDIMAMLEYEGSKEKLKEERSKTRITFRNGSEVFILTAETKIVSQEAKGLMGFGASVVIIDESNLIPDLMFSKILRMVGGVKNGKLIQLGNPFDPNNHFYRAFFSPRYEKLIIKKEQALTEGRITQEFLDECQEEMSPMDFTIFYDCEFPEAGAEDALIPRDWIENAVNQKDCGGDHKQTGLDVARFGCFDNQTEVLTNSGWRLFGLLEGNEEVLSLDVDSDIASWESIEQLHKYDFDGYLNLYDGKRVNFCITDNHRLLVKANRKVKQGWKLREYSDISKNFVLKRTNGWIGKNRETIRFKSVCKMPHGGERVKVWTFNFIDWARLLGWFVSEGFVYEEKRRNGRYRILITQNPGERREMISGLLNKMGLCYRLKNNQLEFWNNEIGRYLLNHCGKGASNKRVPDEIKNASTDIIEAFLQTYFLGDGSNRKNGKGKTYITNSKLLADDIQEMLVKIGRTGKISIGKRAGTEFIIEGRKQIRRYDVYNIYEIGKNRDSDLIKAKVKKVHYIGKVYCVSTKYKTIMVRRKGCPMWSGNSDKTVYLFRKGGEVRRIDVTEKMDTMEVTGWTTEKLQNDAPDVHCTDVIGIGAGVHDRLVELQGSDNNDSWTETEIVPVNVGEAPAGWDGDAEAKDRFFNLRAQIFWHLRTLFKPDKDGHSQISIPNDPELKKQLEEVRYRYSSERKIKIEAKEDMKKRIGVSPDKGDALALAFWNTASSQPELYISNI